MIEIRSVVYQVWRDGGGHRVVITDPGQTCDTAGGEGGDDGAVTSNIRLRWRRRRHKPHRAWPHTASPTAAWDGDALIALSPTYTSPPRHPPSPANTAATTTILDLDSIAIRPRYDHSTTMLRPTRVWVCYTAAQFMWPNIEEILLTMCLFLR